MKYCAFLGIIGIFIAGCPSTTSTATLSATQKQSAAGTDFRNYVTSEIDSSAIYVSEAHVYKLPINAPVNSDFFAITPYTSMLSASIDPNTTVQFNTDVSLAADSANLALIGTDIPSGAINLYSIPKPAVSGIIVNQNAKTVVPSKLCSSFAAGDIPTGVAYDSAFHALAYNAATDATSERSCNQTSNAWENVNSYGGYCAYAPYGTRIALCVQLANKVLTIKSNGEVIFTLPYLGTSTVNSLVVSAAEKTEDPTHKIFNIGFADKTTLGVAYLNSDYYYVAPSADLSSLVLTPADEVTQTTPAPAYFSKVFTNGDIPTVALQDSRSAEMKLLDLTVPAGGGTIVSTNNVADVRMNKFGFASNGSVHLLQNTAGDLNAYSIEEHSASKLGVAVPLLVAKKARTVTLPETASTATHALYQNSDFYRDQALCGEDVNEFTNTPNPATNYIRDVDGNIHYLDADCGLQVLDVFTTDGYKHIHYLDTASTLLAVDSGNIVTAYAAALDGTLTKAAQFELTGSPVDYYDCTSGMAIQMPGGVFKFLSYTNENSFAEKDIATFDGTLAATMKHDCSSFAVATNSTGTTGSDIHVFNNLLTSTPAVLAVSTLSTLIHIPETTVGAIAYPTLSAGLQLQPIGSGLESIAFLVAGKNEANIGFVGEGTSYIQNIIPTLGPVTFQADPSTKKVNYQSATAVTEISTLTLN